MKTFCEQTFNSSHLQGLIQNLNLGDNTNVSNRWSIMHKRQKNCRQTGLLCSVLCVLTNVLYFKRRALFLGTTFFEQGILNKNYVIFNYDFDFQLFLTIQTSKQKTNLGVKLLAAIGDNQSFLASMRPWFKTSQDQKSNLIKLWWCKLGLIFEQVGLLFVYFRPFLEAFTP